MEQTAEKVNSPSERLKNCAILIPAYQPDKKLIALLKNLPVAEFSRVIVVDDGSGEDFADIFRKVREFDGLTLLSHPVNMGKGAALKTGMLFAYNQLAQCNCVITADADGQHTVEDIIKLADRAENEPGKLWLGVRSFDKDVPVRSLVGNKLTAFLMRLLLGICISDTQTGLRAIPRDFMPILLQISCNRYEFELEMLLSAKQTGRQIGEVPISTVYLNDNASSHFNPLLDSLKIYVVLFRYILVSILTAVTDYLIYVPALWICAQIFSPATATAVAVATGRIAGAAVQYTLVKKVVFYSQAAILKTLPKYIALVICSGCASYLIMHAIESTANWNFYIAKLAAEVIIYLANFLIQRDFIFCREEK